MFIQILAPSFSVLRASASIVTWKGRSMQCCFCSIAHLFFSQNLAPTLGAVFPAASRPLLGVFSPTTLCHLLRGSPARAPPQCIILHPTPLAPTQLFFLKFAHKSFVLLPSHSPSYFFSTSGSFLTRVWFCSKTQKDFVPEVLNVF